MNKMDLTERHIRTQCPTPAVFQAGPHPTTRTESRASLETLLSRALGDRPIDSRPPLNTVAARAANGF
jgi:hypothetical protein